MITSPPRPPSPPEGPPRGTNFSRRKATQPLPPSPAFTRILASSMNISDFTFRVADHRSVPTTRVPHTALGNLGHQQAGNARADRAQNLPRYGAGEVRQIPGRDGTLSLGPQ